MYVVNFLIYLFVIHFCHGVKAACVNFLGFTIHICEEVCKLIIDYRQCLLDTIKVITLTQILIIYNAL